MHVLNRRFFASVAILGLTLATSACVAPSEPLGPDSVGPDFAALTAVPARGTETTLDFGTWNLEWFGDPDNGPGDEALQLENVRDIIAGLDMDLWAVEEVTGETHFADLVSQLSGYDGFLANDASVTNGPEYYSDFNDNELKVGLIYKTSAAVVNSARVILTQYDYEFAGRPPLEIQVTTSVDGVSRDMTVIVLHAKAGSGRDDWDRRNTASAALKAYLDSAYTTVPVMVLGDFNDDVDQSITRPKESPYKNFVDDAADYVFPTEALSDAGITSTVNYSEMIDHHLGTDELIATYVDGSVEVFPADEYVADYGQTTSDHFPVLSRYTAGSTGSTNGAPTASFVYTCTDLACDFDGTGSSDPDADALSYSWDFGDGMTATGSVVSYAYAAGGTYTVTLTVDDGGLSDSDSQAVSVTESAGDGIQLSATGYTVRGKWTVDLTWSGASSTDVDVFRDGAKIATTPNDGAYTDGTQFRGSGSLTYKVCEAGTATCSNEVTVVF